MVNSLLVIKSLFRYLLINYDMIETEIAFKYGIINPNILNSLDGCKCSEVMV